jgi:phosphoenolpyruvate carboxylase
MDSLATDSCAAYRSVVYKNPKFISYFKHATPGVCVCARVCVCVCEAGHMHVV